MNFPLLEKITSPADFRQFSEAELLQLASELRQYTLQALSQVGGI